MSVDSKVGIAAGAPLRALVVAYAFPPVGGAGVQRVAKFVKYLPRHGVSPTVLTVANPSVPVRDESLVRDVAGVDVVRARTFEPGYGVKQAAWSSMAPGGSGEGRERRAPSLRSRLISAGASTARALLVPDPQILWLPAASAKLVARVLRGADDVVFVSGPPFSQFLLAPLASARAAVVLDYRDEWSTYRTAYEMSGSRLVRAAGDALEPALLRAATAVTTATEEFREELLARFRFLDPARVVTIPNGYDREDLPDDLPSPPRDRFVATYAGTIFKLTSPRGLLGALRLLQSREPDLAKLLEVRFLGRIVDTERAAFDGIEAVRLLGYVPHEQVFPALAESHLALCLLDDVPGTDRIYPAKIFELMHLGRPVLTLAPEGALTRLVRAHGVGEVLPPRDEAAIAASLERRLREFQAKSPEQRDRVAPLGARDVERYDRAALAGELARVLQLAAAAKRRA
jgi:glycosyltransferase involved in cell wall biosynthesis